MTNVVSLCDVRDAKTEEQFKCYIPVINALLNNDRLSYFELRKELIGKPDGGLLFDTFDMMGHEFYGMSYYINALKLNYDISIEVKMDNPEDEYPTVLVLIMFHDFVLYVKGFPLSGQLTHKGYQKGKLPDEKTILGNPFTAESGMIKFFADLYLPHAAINQGGWRVDSERQISYVVAEPRATHTQILCVHLMNV